MSRRVWLAIGGGVLVAAVAVVTTLLAVTPIALQPNAAPWWAVPVFTLAGGVAGATIAGLFTTTVERRRSASAEKLYRDEKVREAVFDLLGVADGRQTALFTGKWTTDDETNLWRAINKVFVIAPDAIGTAAFELGVASRGVVGGRSTLRDTLLQTQVSEARSKLLVEVRRYFGVHVERQEAAVADD